MSLSLELLEDVQEVYAYQLKLTLLFIDRNGNLLNAPKGDNLLCNKLLQEEENHFLPTLKEKIKYGRFPKKPIFYDVIPGIYSIIAPVDKGDYYLCAGVFVDSELLAVEENKLSHLFHHELERSKLFTSALTITEDEKAFWIKKVEKVTALLEQTSSKREFSYENQVKLIQTAIAQKGENAGDFLEISFENNPQFDFLGLAEEREDEQFEVTHMLGEGKDLSGALFSLGESFLGRALITDEKELIWKDIEHDPRASLFKRYNFHPKSIYCYPVQKHNDTRAILFTGTVQSKELPPAAFDQGKVLAAILEMRYYTYHLQQENTQQITRLSSLVDICMLMASTPDVKRIIYILVDISLNLVEGTFSCITLRTPDSEKIQLVSRGSADRNIREYAKNAAIKYYNNQQPAASLPVVIETEDGECIIECPLVHRGELLGLLSVGCSGFSNEEIQEQQAFLHTLSIIGAVSIQLARQEREDPAEGKIEALVKAASHFDPASYEKSLSMVETADQFLEKLDIPDCMKENIRNACRLCMYEPALLKEVLAGNKLIQVLDESEKLMLRKPSCTWESAREASRIMAVIRTYADHEEQLEAVKSLPGPKEQGVIHDFCVFIEEVLIAEEEFALVEEVVDITSVVPFPPALKYELNVSPREQEVLNLVIQGLNNKEIAKELYISDHTVKNHVTKIFQKLNVSDRAQAISKVYQLKYE